MKFLRPRSVAAFVVTSALVVAGFAAAQGTPPKSTEPKKGAQDACMEMMQGPGVTEQGKQAMHDFMKSPKAGEAMTRMMEMARKMGNGNPMLGMTKMMEMMGGQGGMMSPGAPPSTK